MRWITQALWVGAFLLLAFITANAAEKASDRLDPELVEWQLITEIGAAAMAILTGFCLAAVWIWSQHRRSVKDAAARELKRGIAAEIVKTERDAAIAKATQGLEAMMTGMVDEVMRTLQTHIDDDRRFHTRVTDALETVVKTGDLAVLHQNMSMLLGQLNQNVQSLQSRIDKVMRGEQPHHRETARLEGPTP